MSPALKTSQARRSLKAKGLTTRAAILETAQEVFRDLGYYQTSVSEITRRCGVSIGTFYQYFKNKEQIFLELNDLILSRFWERAEGLPPQAGSLEGRLAGVVGLLVDHISSHFYFHRILGEFELIDSVTIGYYDSIARFYRNFFRREAGLGNIRPFDPNLITYGLIGMVYFNSLDWGPKSAAYRGERLVSLIVDLVLKGISGPRPWNRPGDQTAPPTGRKTKGHPEPEEEAAQGQLTKRALFQAAETVFGQYGFNRANVSEITRLAGVAQGTFYTHFKSKRNLLEGFVRYLSRELRRTLKQATEGLADRRDQEREGLRTFFRFLHQHSRIYRVVGESETVGLETGMWYYQKLAEGYVAGIRDGLKQGEIREFPAPFLARALMGVNHVVGLKWLVWNSYPQAELPQPLLNELGQWVLTGLGTSEKESAS
ncbi:MAG: TetR/AcrR family transcriptional regulator [Deltaproteobacteria bacterium]|nr:TetR/AcrR family transcriptional regulator [Deltaproteobacteria bacterium]